MDHFEIDYQNFVSQSRNNLFTKLHYAAMINNVDIASKLLKNGAIINIDDVLIF